jgi:hypothetical protein
VIISGARLLALRLLQLCFHWQRTILSSQGLPGDSDFKTTLAELKAQVCVIAKGLSIVRSKVY